MRRQNFRSAPSGGLSPSRQFAAFSPFARLSLASFLATLSCIEIASAQTETALDRYEPSPAGASLASVPDASDDRDFSVKGELRLSAAKSPLVLVDSNSEDSRLKVVGHQFVLHPLLSVAFFRHFSLDLNLPLILSQAGESVEGGLPIQAPTGATLGDLRVAGQVGLVSQEKNSPAVAFRLTGWLPTGNAEEFTSTGSTRLSPTLSVGAKGDWGAYGANFGPRVAVSSGDTGLIEGEFLARVGGGPRFGALLLTAEALSTFQQQPDDEHIFDGVPHLEGVLHAKVDVGNWFFRAGLTLGLTDAIGTPAYRGILGVGYSPEFGDEQEAHESSLEQSGPKVPAQSTSLPLGSDSDGDGLKDAEDQCPRVPGKIENQGCPEDRDKDGIADVLDACVDVSGVEDPDPELHGCPADQDKDGIVDEEDACIHEKGVATEDSKTHGCPKSVRIEGTRLLILQQIVFATGSATIAEESNGLLQEVADTLQAHPEIEVISIEGHTDSAGSLKKNLALSRRRAIAVMRWLIDAEVDEDRLQATGYGPKRPLESNRTAAGRARNRRVEFIIVDRTGDTTKVSTTAESSNE